MASYEKIVVKDESDTDTMKLARETRLKLRSERIAIEKMHTILKADSLKTGRAIDFVKNTALEHIKPVEEYLKEQEEFAERAQQARRDERIMERTKVLQQYTDDVTIYNYGDMADDMFDVLLNQVKAAHELKVAAEEKAEQDRITLEAAAEAERIAKEEADRKARIEAEAKAAELQAQLEAERKVQAEKDAVIAKERAEAARIQAQKDADAAAILKAEQERAAKLEAQAAAHKQAEAKRIADEQAAAVKAAAAPDKEKLLNYVGDLGALDFPILETGKADIVATRISDHLRTSLKTYRELIEKEL
jgi:hypothetical protein